MTRSTQKHNIKRMFVRMSKIMMGMFPLSFITRFTKPRSWWGENSFGNSSFNTRSNFTLLLMIFVVFSFGCLTFFTFPIFGLLFFSAIIEVSLDSQSDGFPSFRSSAILVYSLAGALFALVRVTVCAPFVLHEFRKVFSFITSVAGVCFHKIIISCNYGTINKTGA
jgi:hypothetical protein